ncbi:MAG: hypothetical protein JXB38_14410 [Anaerolineales bacterium]|nr:hypothetical protein [Anaerolineales bacterium]
MVDITPTPMPGWRSPVYQLLVDDTVFPQDWTVEFPQDTSTDSTANHVGRTWGNVVNGAHAEQAIWRAYSIADAQRKYDELQSQFHPSRPSEPNAIFVEPKPPTEISFQSPAVDEIHLACGWVHTAYCVVVARYRNYVTDIRLDLQEEHEGIHSDGLTYEQIENIVMAMDTKFAEFLSSFPLETSTP